MSLNLLNQILNYPTPIEEVHPQWITESSCQLFIKRDDLIHPIICGNKWRKLKYSVTNALAEDVKTLVSFGGAFSNHLTALAAVGKISGLRTIGFVRSYLTDIDSNPSIELMKSNYMDVTIVHPTIYKEGIHSEFIQSFLTNEKDYVVIPEGGSHESAIQGLKEMMEEVNSEHIQFDSIFCSLGTGTSVAGIAKNIDERTDLYGVSPFKSRKINFRGLQLCSQKELDRIKIIPSVLNADFGGFHEQLMPFIASFKAQTNILLEPIYTAKSMMTIKSMVENGQLHQQKILFIHTGGLQGIQGYRYRFKNQLHKR